MAVIQKAAMRSTGLDVFARSAPGKSIVVMIDWLLA